MVITECSFLTLPRRWSGGNMLEDLEVFMAVEVDEEEAKEVCRARSWSPGLGSPTLVAPALSMAVF